MSGSKPANYTESEAQQLHTRKRKVKGTRLNRLSSNKNNSGSDFIKESVDSIMRQSLGTEKLNQDFFSFLKSPIKSRKKH